MDALSELPTLHILLIDDDEDDYVWIRRVLAGEGAVQIDWAPSYEEGCAAIRTAAHDVILVDYRLCDEEGRDGLDIVRKAREEQSGTPCVLFTGVPRVGLEIASLAAGAAGFLTKSEVSQSRLMHAILQAIERGKTESELFQKNRALSLILSAAEAANEALTEKQAFDACLRDVCAKLGWDVSDALLVSERGELSLLTVYANEDKQLAELRARQLPRSSAGLLAQVFQTNQRVFCANLATCEDEAYRELAAAGMDCALLLPVVARGQVVAVLELFSTSASERGTSDTQILTAMAAQLAQTVVRARADSERRRVEGELRRSQRLDALGRLAGGIAHDFNNLLTVISASAELLLGLEPKLRTDDNIEPMLEAAQRGARLTRQLLALGQKNLIAPRVVDVNSLIRNSEALLRRTLREDIDLRFELSPRVGCIEVDPGEFEQLLLNLVLNARDAIEGRGRLTVSTDRCTHADREQLGAAEQCVCVDVRDTGIGMSTETLEHLFDPFYTTKEAGKGTGLGLACVYGIVRKVGGTIDVESEPGVGTWFRLSFPMQRSGPSAPPPDLEETELPQGTETILLVEDDTAVRTMTARLLERLGYRVLGVANADEALKTARRQNGFDLVLSDVVMPGMSGIELAGQLATLHPNTPVLFMSGYAQAAVEREGLMDVGRRLVLKPFTTRELAVRVRRALDEAVHVSMSEVALGPH